MSLFKAIKQALEMRLNLLDPRPPIAWENTDYEPSPREAYIAPFLIPAASNLADLDYLQNNLGIFQIDIYVPADKGTGEQLAIADNISNLFKAQKLPLDDGGVVRIYAISPPRNGGREEAWYKASVDINWQCFSQ